MKCTSFWKHTSCQYWIRKKQTIQTDQMKLQDGSFPSVTGKLYQTYKEELMTILSRLVQKIEENETLSNSFYLAVGHPYSAIETKYSTGKKGKENYRPISLIEIYARIINRILANQIQQYINKIYKENNTLWLVGFIQGVKGCFNIHKSINTIDHINRRKDKKSHG